MDSLALYTHGEFSAAARGSSSASLLLFTHGEFSGVSTPTPPITPGDTSFNPAPGNGGGGGSVFDCDDEFTRQALDSLQTGTGSKVGICPKKPKRKYQWTSPAKPSKKKSKPKTDIGGISPSGGGLEALQKELRKALKELADLKAEKLAQKPEGQKPKLSTNVLETMLLEARIQLLEQRLAKMEREALAAQTTIAQPVVEVASPVDLSPLVTVAGVGAGGIAGILIGGNLIDPKWVGQVVGGAIGAYVGWKLTQPDKQ